MNKFLLVLLGIALFGCAENKEGLQSIYFAGEIVNPTDSQVILYKGDKAVDSALLDSENRFAIQLDAPEDGLYNFYHRPEFQYVYLEKGDSLQVRLNTVAFDESLVYSGQGEGINNFLIELFLESESEEYLIGKSYIPMEPEAFKAKLDSLEIDKIRRLEGLQEDFEITESAYKMAHSSIRYKNFYYKEKYPFWHRKMMGDGGLHDLPQDFYDYRNSVSYDEPSLTFLKPYYDFMIYHIGNLAFTGCRKSCDIQNNTVLNQLHFNRHQLHLIDSLVTGFELRDNLFRSVAFEYLLKNDSKENINTFMKDFHTRSGNNRHLTEIENLSEAISNLSPDSEIPDLKVENEEGVPVSLRDIAANEPVVFYFWSGPEPRHLANISRKVRALNEKYKNYRFVGICLRTERDRWKSLIDSYSLPPEDQFWAGDYNKFAHTLVVYHPYKSILVRDGKIMDGFANLNTSF